MTKRIITISREFGSGGRFIGEEVANGRCRQKAYGELQFLYESKMGKSQQLYVVSE